MKKVAMIAILLLNFTFVAAQSSFKERQKKYPRVRQAYADKEKVAEKSLADNGIKASTLQPHLRTFKQEKELQVWAKNKNDEKYTLIKTYKFRSLSGALGTRRKQGDRQVPEGFYRIDRFNPYSNFYLSLGISYPNKSDQVLGVKGKPGGDIFIHGDCATIGCIPITDDKIKELYVYCVEAKNNNTLIPVTIFR
ncbi:MAG: L,D-transpeptidase family protein [Prevotellaceae bacterium]|jgi:murein L,D-transpeptidase YafK|nr:L,D-transpeptidase family protein [Prevotellaceae bacterium]